MTIAPVIRRVYRSMVLNPVAPDRVESFEPGYLVVAYGKVMQLTRKDPRSEFPDAEFVDLNDRMIIPGLIDAHVHLPQFRIMGKGKGELLEWLRDYTYPEEARFADAEYAGAVAEEFFHALVRKGTTAAMIYSSIHEAASDVAFATAARSGIRAFIGKTMMDRNAPPPLLEDTGESIRASNRLFDKWDGAENGRLRYVYTPRFAGSCSMELMTAAGKAARERNAFVQSHLSENKAEVELVRRLFAGSSSYTDVYNRAGLLHEKSIMAHCIHLSDEEVRILSNARTKVAFCPYSNRTLRSGTMPYRKLRDHGLQIALGSDVAGGPSLSMLDQIREASAIVTPDEALYLATMGGAIALGIADQVGNFAPGKEATFIVMDKDKNSPSAVYVQGEPVYLSEL